jgi:hypothetical protein
MRQLNYRDYIAIAIIAFVVVITVVAMILTASK